MSNNARSWLPLAVIAFVAGGTGYWLLDRLQSAAVPMQNAAPEALSRSELVGKRRPDFSLPDLDGAIRDLREWDGQVVLVNFWASWCPPCRKEMPGFERVYRQLKDRGFQIVGVAIEDPEAARAFVDEIEISYPLLHGRADASAISREFGNRMGALPFSVLIDRDGVMRFFRAGELSEAQLTAEAERLL
ncbi:MAG: TlpA family protein disulfide reductase [Thiotrichales bacterium]